MPSKRIARTLNNGTYFLTFVVRNHIDVFNRNNRWDTLADTLEFYIARRNIIMEGFVFMRNHLHFIITSTDTINFVRGFKSFISRKLKKNILETESELMTQFINNHGKYQFWEKTNMPLFIEDENPVRAGYVEYKEDWHWSSVNEKCPLHVDRSNW